MRIELTTYALRVRCSTPELPGRVFSYSTLQFTGATCGIGMSEGHCKKSACSTKASLTLSPSAPIALWIRSIA